MSLDSVYLANLVNLHTFPTDLKYVRDKSRDSTQMSGTVHNKVLSALPITFKHDSQLLSRTFQPLLDDLARAFAADVAFSGPTRHDAIKDVLRVASRNAAQACAREQLSGEAGTQAFFHSHLITQLNALIAELPGHVASSYDLYWRIVGQGSAGKADFELVLFCRVTRQESILAVVEVKTPGVFSQSLASRWDACLQTSDAILMADADGNIDMPLSGLTQVQLAKLVDIHEQIAGEWITRRCTMAAITTGELFLLYDITGSEVLVSPLMMPGLAADSRALYQSYLGLMLGMTLRSLRKGGYESLLPSASSHRQPSNGMQLAGDEDTLDDTDDATPRTSLEASNPFSNASGFDCHQSFSNAHLTGDMPPSVAGSPSHQLTPESSPDHSVKRDKMRTGLDRHAPPPLIRSWVKGSRISDPASIPPTPEASPKYQLVPSQIGSSSFLLSFLGNSMRSRTCLKSLRFESLFYGPFPISASVSSLPALLANDNDRIQESRLASTQIDDRSTVAPQLCVNRNGSVSVSTLKGEGGSCAVFGLADTPGVVAKITNVDFYPTQTPPNDRTTFTQARVRESFARDATVLNGPLKLLQGRVVPRFIGLYGSSQVVSRTGDDLTTHAETWCMFQSDAGQILDEQARCRLGLYEQLKGIYAQLHDAGVIHNDVSWRNIVEQDGCVMVVDFGNARLKSTMGVEAWHRATLREMARLDILLEHET